MEQKKCIVRVLSILKHDGETEEIETLSEGFLREKEKSVEIVYREIADDESEETKVHITFSSSESGSKGYECRIVRKGSTESEMLFLPDYETCCMYRTPFGELGFEVNTSLVEFNTESECVKGHLKYSLSSNGSALSEAEVTIIAV